MNQEIFLMQMNRLATALQFDPEEKVLLSEYFPTLKRLGDKRFAEVIEYLRDNYTNKFKFPQPGDFWSAYRSTNKFKAPTTYKPELRDDGAKNPLSLGFIQKSFKIQKAIRRQVFGNFLRDNPDKNSEDIIAFSHTLMFSFYSSKITAGEVFDIKNKKWVEKPRAVEQEDEEYWNPAMWGFKSTNQPATDPDLKEIQEELPF